MLTAESRRAQFPSLEQMVYFNSAAEGIPPLVVREALLEYFRDKQQGMDGRGPHFAALSETQALVGSFYGLSAEEVGICSCSSEAYNLAAMALSLQDGDEVIINDLDFPAGATPWLQPSCPATVQVWRSREGALYPEDLAPLLTARTRLVAVSLVSFFNGFRLSVPEVADVITRRSEALLSVDVTQALGRIPLDLAGADLIVSSTHKWILSSHGGGLVGVPTARAREWTVPAGGWFNLHDPFGGHRFETAISKPGAASFAVGMPNFPAIYAIRAGLKYIQSVGVQAIDEATRPLVQQALSEIAQLPVELLTPRDLRHVAGIIAFRHPRAEEVAQALRQQNIHLMSHAGRLRVAIHGYNTAGDVDKLLVALRASL
ncbi:MAG: aminotransferase class V-fold PLP-dependent enzyme [Planctomycetota bacterium]|nr:MAG: aminotransferase class V-fold PLP-dependent enzyme [Planctomycetota bacterium]